jgi:hypothetical protein
MAEAGYPEVEGDGWVGVLVPARTPKEIIAARSIARSQGSSHCRTRPSAPACSPLEETRQPRLSKRENSSLPVTTIPR